uniref:hypothetical protein n=1 Tax=uncultured Caulobacter sp. TaxID=158749 RepID=UPI0025FF6211|nr:hypothetical protein [uncultured Caulobacter sp.]
MSTLGVYGPETSENTFSRLPVRQHEKVLVWFSRSEGRAWLEADPDLTDAQARPAQVLRLDPTARSTLR